MIDLGHAGQGFFPMLVALVGVAILTVGALWAAVKRAAPLARTRGVRAAVDA